MEKFYQRDVAVPSVSNVYSNLNEVLMRRAAHTPEKCAYTFLAYGEGDQAEQWSYRELDSRARAIAAALQSAGEFNQRVLLVYPPGLEFIAAFWGCLYAGAVAIPTYPPRATRGLERFQAIADDSQATVALSTQQILGRMGPAIQMSAGLGKLHWIASDGLDESNNAGWNPPKVDGSSLAFIQYTSGSTSAPKGVLVTHSNLLHNQVQLKRIFQQSEESIIVGWLPLYHDMGLIGNVLQSLFVGARCILLSPVAFLQEPLRWLQTISSYSATTSGGPNFAYDLCVRKIKDEQVVELNLTSWQTAFNGAEPVRASTMERFAAKFAPAGFNAKSFCPCYGLAEATLVVSGKDAGASYSTLGLEEAALARNEVRETSEVNSSRTVVSCGPVITQEIRIVNPESCLSCKPDKIGEIWVANASVAEGYWNRPEETQQIFRARIANTQEGPFLRTGDLGFVHGNDLFVTGRLKDLIIIRGRNHYPQDLELTVENAHSCMRPGCGAAFSVDFEGEEKVVIVQEVDRPQMEKLDGIVHDICERLAELHEVQPYAIAFLPPGTIPKTSSGKIQRSACRAKFLAGKLNPVLEWRSSNTSKNATEALFEEPGLLNSIEQWLLQKLAARTGVSPASINVDDSITRLGLDSLAAIELAHALDRELGLVADLNLLLEGPSIRQLAATLLDHGSVTSKCPDAAPAPSEFPLSQGQQSLWFLHQLAPESTAYNLAFAAHVPMELNSAALKTALYKLGDRHSALHTTFHCRNGDPFQAISAQPNIYFEEIDASTLDIRVLTRLFEAEAEHRFNLERGPLFRVKLFRRSASNYFICLTTHHVIADLWSLALLMHELTILYAAELGKPLSLPPVTSTYFEFVEWQKRMLASAAGAALWDYWKEELGGELPVLSLPLDRPRPAVQPYKGASKYFEFSSDVTMELRRLAQDHRATLYMTLLAAFQLLLSRYSGQEDVLVGSPIAGRNRDKWSGVVGYFVNPVVLRARLSANPEFTGFLAQVRQTVLRAFQHGDYPYPNLVERLQPVRDASYSPLFQAMFAFEKTVFLQHQGIATLALGEAGNRLEFNGFPLEPAALQSKTAPFDVMLMIAEAGGSLCGSFRYNTDLFDEPTIARLLRHWQALLQGVVAAPHTRVEEIALLSVEERRQIVQEWNRTDANYASEPNLADLFEKQAASTPQETALIWASGSMTYAVLNRRANQLAHYLRRHGVAREQLVAVCMRRNEELIVALLAVLKAGGAYVPLDPAYPTERLHFVLEDSRPKVLLTQQGLPAVLPDYRGKYIFVDQEEPSIAGENDRNPERTGLEEDLAYLIYTSGSTGRPKAVMITHRSALIFCHWSHTVFSAEELASVLASTSVCFDLSVFELFVPITRGGSILLVENIFHLPLIGSERRVTLINTVPSVLTEFLRVAEMPLTVSTVNLAGEALGAELVNQLFKRSTVKRVFNLYGPSEDTTYSTCASLRGGDDKAPCIGRPITKTEIYILERNLNPVPVGVVGEIYIGGQGLARGYWNRPDITAEKFIPSPFSQLSGSRIYKTGDLGRYDSNGVIEYLGRADQQVKIRGFRIEPGEIEAVLASLPEVAEAAVVAREDDPGDKRLVGYIVFDKNAEGSIERISHYLHDKLPEYMVPSIMMRLEQMPLGPNGKLNRKALPRPTITSHVQSTGRRSPVEELLAEMWASVLKLNRVGTQDSFFDLGGHSLLAMQVIARIRDTFKIELPLRYMFERKTIEGLARIIEAQMGTASGNGVERLRPRPASEKGKLSYAQQRLWFLDQFEPGHAFYNLPAVLWLEGRLDIDGLEHSLNEVIKRHESLRTHFAIAVDGEPEQVVDEHLTLQLVVKEVSGATREEKWMLARQLAEKDARLAFNLSTGPLVRVQLLRLSDCEHVALITTHHIVSDGWSQAVLVEELAEFYRAYVQGDQPRLKELPIQYRDYAAWQHEWLQGEVLERQTSYWRQQLHGMSGATELPTDAPRPAIQTYRGAHYGFEFAGDLTKALQNFTRAEDATLFMVLLAALQALLWRYTGQKDIAIGTPVANRTRQEIERLVGFFANTLVLRTELDDKESFRDLLKRVRETALDAYAHQDLPFEKLVEELHPHRDLSRSPIFQIMLVLQNAPATSLELPQLKCKLLRGENNSSKFDLLIEVNVLEDRLAVSVEYSTDLFREKTVASLMQHWTTLLGQAVKDPYTCIGSVGLLGEHERSEILYGGNQTAVARPQQGNLCELFERQAQKTPEGVALIFNGAQLQYRELNCRSNQFAHYLKSLGVGPDQLVGICMKRSLNLVTSLLAVLKSGAAYVPLDPAYPKERLNFMLADAGVSLLITDECLVESLPVIAGKVICPDRDLQKIGAWPETGIDSKYDSETLAYVIYTSGSTERPKGVMITHRSALAFCHWAQTVFTREELSGVLASTSICFDLSIFELFVPLSWGGTVILVETLFDLPETKSDVTLINTVPSVMTEFLRGRELAESIVTVNVAGETLQGELVRRILQAGRSVRILNLYGPSEDTTYSTCMQVDPEEPWIGRPLENKQVYILDENLEPVPQLVAGQIYIGGDGLARGYWKRPDLTAERFVPDPHGRKPGSRLYKTGDLGRYRAVGVIEYLGRTDQQVKIRGFRIELGEIESVLSTVAGISDAVVVVREDVSGDKRLVAYVVLEKEADRSKSRMPEIKEHLLTYLPEYMVPSAIVELERMPLNPNGKLDRKLLPKPPSEAPPEFVAPRNNFEQRLAQLWIEVLSLDRISIHDNFFACGGHSLKAAQLVARIRNTFRSDLTVKTLFEAPTIATLAARIATTTSADNGLPELVPVPRENRAIRLPLKDDSLLSQVSVES